MIHTAILEDNPVHRDRLKKILEDIYMVHFLYLQYYLQHLLDIHLH